MSYIYGCRRISYEQIDANRRVSPSLPVWLFLFILCFTICCIIMLLDTIKTNNETKQIYLAQKKLLIYYYYIIIYDYLINGIFIS